MTIGGCGLGLRTFSCALSDSGPDVRGHGPRPVYDFHSPKQKTAIGKQETEPRPPNIIQIDQNLLETRLERFGAEADEIAEAVRYECSGRWEAFHDGHYDRSLTAKAGRLGLKVPKLKGEVFESAVIERHRRREESVDPPLSRQVPAR